MIIDEPSDLVPLIFIATAILTGLAWIIKSQLAMQKAFQPNGGSSVKDQLNRIESQVQKVSDRVDDHIDWHMNR
jgi:Ni/Fe-hydrogenase subunit HybB-like protein